MVYRINKDGKREQIENYFGLVWKDGNIWKVQMKSFIHSTKTKREAYAIQQAFCCKGGSND